MYNFERSRTNKGYVSSVRVCVCIYEALISMTITRINRKCPRVSGQKRLETTTREKSARDANARSQEATWSVFFFTQTFEKRKF